jgi:error-prone DNA polymerase
MFVELHAQSAFTFLEGADQPEALVTEAARRGMSALALVDRDGVYGAPRFHRAAVDAGIRPLVGSELTLAGGARLPVLVEDREGWQNLCALITRAKLGAPKGKAAITLEDLEASATGLVCLTGGAHGPLAAAVHAGDREAARRMLDRLVGIFGRGNVFVEVQRHFDRQQERDLERLVTLARSARVPLLAANQPLYARAGGRAVADVFTCIREKTDLDHAGRRLLINAERGLRDAPTMAEAFRDLPDAAGASGELALRLGFTLKDLGYRFPDFPLPPGASIHAHLRDLVARGVRDRYGVRGPVVERARRQVAHELEIIGRLELAGYFLIVWDVVEFCRGNEILVQGRGSAANSAVCYALGITAVDPIKMDLLFERFLSESRGEWPDIDLDLPSGERRERVIQYVYRRYGRLGAGMTANVVTYRGRSAAREIGKALGLPGDMQDRLARLVENWGYQDPEAVLTRHLVEAGCDTRHPRIRKFAALWTRLQDFPRHLGQHSGGMVIAAGRLDHVVPLEPATMPGRVVVQWDKDDCAALGIVKVDLLGLRMMSVLQESIALVSETGGTVDLAQLPADDPTVYRMLQCADTIGVFQVESRAQMATLPRIHPERFYDLVVQIAIIRPGPIVGDMVHPYVRRRRGREPVTYAHPSLEPILARTLGVPLFQEQLLRIAMVAAGFTGTEAEELRRAFGFKRSERRMAEVEVKLREGMARRGITGPTADEIVHQITSFALYGFPESHSSSFALLAYASAYLKAHHGPAFYTALLNNQPMGFYHSATVVNDARRHGVRVLPVDVTRSDWLCTLEWRDDTWTVRLGLRFVKGLRERAAQTLMTARAARPFASPADLAARAELTHEEIGTLASIGALAALGGTRRANLWRVAERDTGPLFAEPLTISNRPPTVVPDLADPATTEPLTISNRPPTVVPDLADPATTEPLTISNRPPTVVPDLADPAITNPLREMSALERLVADYAGTGVTLGPHPMALRRAALAVKGVTRAIDLARGENGTRVRVAGSVIVRQRPGTAKGFVFLSLEDETGIANVIVTPGLFARRRLPLVTEPFLLVEGILQMQDGVVSVRATRVESLPSLAHVVPSHDFG